MSTAKTTKPHEPHDMSGFDVTCVIGHVSTNMDEIGDHPTPYHAAMALIADHDTDGEYVFPSAQGGTTHIYVEHRNADRE